MFAREVARTNVNCQVPGVSGKWKHLRSLPLIMTRLSLTKALLINQYFLIVVTIDRTKRLSKLIADLEAPNIPPTYLLETALFLFVQ